jgi:hypothetical protein
MTRPVLTPMTIQLSTTAASITPIIPTDFRFETAEQSRLFVLASAHANDNFVVLGTPDYWNKTTGQAATSPTLVTITASLSIGANRVTVVAGPWTGFRIQKVGENSPATIKLVI